MTATLERPTETLVVPDTRRGVRILPTWEEQHVIDDATAMRFWSAAGEGDGRTRDGRDVKWGGHPPGGVGMR
jgi:hypothetical protein